MTCILSFFTISTSKQLLSGRFIQCSGGFARNKRSRASRQRCSHSRFFGYCGELKIVVILTLQLDISPIPHIHIVHMLRKWMPIMRSLFYWRMSSEGGGRSQPPNYMEWLPPRQTSRTSRAKYWEQILFSALHAFDTPPCEPKRQVDYRRSNTSNICKAASTGFSLRTPASSSVCFTRFKTSGGGRERE